MKTERLVRGVGINDANYAVVEWEITEVNGVRKQRRVWDCLYYRVWADMIRRCYSAKFQESNPTYKNCTVSDEWLTFSNFRAWMAAQDWEDKHLDKDILFEGNKMYSEDTCVFVTRMVNNFANDQRARRGEWLIGVCWSKEKAKFQAQCSNPFSKKIEHLGYFTCEQAAHNAWQKRKLELAYELAAIQTDERVAEALINRYSKYKH